MLTQDKGYYITSIEIHLLMFVFLIWLNRHELLLYGTSSIFYIKVNYFALFASNTLK